MKVSKKQIKNLVELILLEDTWKVNSSFTTRQRDSSKKGSSRKAVSSSQQKNVDSGEESDLRAVQGTLPNGISYSSENFTFKWKDSTKSNQKFLSIMNKEEGKSVGVGYAVHKGKPQITLFEDGKIIKNPFKVLGTLFTMGVNPIDIINVIKEISTDIDTSELEKEIKK